MPMQAVAARLRAKSAAVFLVLMTLSLAGITFALSNFSERRLVVDAYHAASDITKDLLALVTPEILEGNHDFVRRLLIHTALHDSVVRIAVLNEANHVELSSHRGDERGIPEGLSGFDPRHAKLARTAAEPVIMRTSRSTVSFASYAAVYSPSEATTLQPQRTWILFLETDWRTHLLAQRQRLLVEVAAIWATLIVICAVGYWIMHGAITQPIERLRTAMRLFASGDTSVRARSRRIDEIGDLARQFNQMIESVLQERQSLADRNEQLHREIQARETAEDRASILHTRLLDAVEALPIGFFLNDRNDRVVLNNARYRALLWGDQAEPAAPGCTVTSLIRASEARYQLTYLTADGNPRILSLPERLAMRSQGGGSFAIRFKSGRYVRVEERPTAEGGMVSIFVDETERRRAEGFLQTSAELAKVGGWWLDPNEMRMELSRELRDILGLAVSDPATDRQQPLPGFAPEDWQKLCEAATKTVQTGQTFDHTIPWLTAEGERRYARLIGHPEHAADRAAGIVGTLQDITDLRHREAADREREKMASLGQLASRVAHEINNILHPIRNDIKTAGELLHTNPKKAAESIDFVCQDTEDLQDLVSRILLFGRRSSLDRTAMPFRSLLEQTTNRLRSGIPSTITLETRIEHGNEPIHASNTDLSQILSNLVGNAVNAVQSDGCIAIISRLVDTPTVVAACPAAGIDRGKNGADASWFRLTVRDNGSGMDEETAAQAFEPFYTTKAAGSGTGLGLSIVKGIVTDLQGHITIETAPGAGCAVHVWLPRASD